NEQRITQRRKAHEEGAWVRDAAAAYASKHTTPPVQQTQHAQQAPHVEETA
ncbi:1,2-phenylacetyl-CoA epoxidase subunit A, partial [Streptomyces sp. SID8455]|nr:1,2-phenylacetyl-CoA epoxidase subunit A [Streptomyces sp. SID8455]